MKNPRQENTKAHEKLSLLDQNTMAVLLSVEEFYRTCEQQIQKQLQAKNLVEDKSPAPLLTATFELRKHATALVVNACGAFRSGIIQKIFPEEAINCLIRALSITFLLKKDSTTYPKDYATAHASLCMLLYALRILARDGGTRAEMLALPSVRQWRTLENRIAACNGSDAKLRADTAKEIVKSFNSINDEDITELQLQAEKKVRSEKKRSARAQLSAEERQALFEEWTYYVKHPEALAAHGHGIGIDARHRKITYRDVFQARQHTKLFQEAGIDTVKKFRDVIHAENARISRLNKTSEKKKKRA